MPTTMQQVQACSKVSGYPTSSFDSSGSYITLHNTPYLAMSREAVQSELREGWVLMGEADGLFVYQMIGFI